LKIKKSEKIMKSEIRIWNFGKLNKKRSKRKIQQGGNSKYTNYSVRRSGRYK